jgi:DNA polymerase-3 subunit delta'
MLFRDVIGQQDLKKNLLDMLAQNRLSHALLFLGNEGSGALPLALAFANYILLPKNSTPEPAGLFGEPELSAFKSPSTAAEADTWMEEQPGYRKLKEMVHPDLHFSYPVFKKENIEKPKSSDFAAEWRTYLKLHPYGNLYDWLQFIKAENKQGNIAVEECNDIVRKISLKSFESGMKILLMWMPEALGNAGNKLLKLIEEPPDDTLFILVAENENKILPTILSRTQLVRVPPLQRNDIAKALVEKNLADPLKAEQVAAFANGNFHEALEQVSHADEDWENKLRDWLNAIVQFRVKNQLEWIDSFVKNGREKQKQFLQFFIHILELSIRYDWIQPEDQMQERPDVAMALRLNKLCGPAEKEAILELLTNAIYYIERNANSKMLFHALTIRLYHIIKNKSLILV